MTWTAAQKRRWDKWVATRPAAVRRLCRRYPPNKRYWLDPPGQDVSICSYGEDGTLRVLVDPEYNPAVILAREVFGIRPEDLSPMEERHV